MLTGDLKEAARVVVPCGVLRRPRKEFVFIWLFWKTFGI